MILLIPLLFAILSRSLGMHHNYKWWGTQVNRIISWAIPIGVVMALVCLKWNLPLWLAIPCAVMAFLAACIGDGTEKGKDAWHCFMMGGLHLAKMWMIILPIPLYYAFALHQPCPIIFALAPDIGLLVGLAYWIGYRIPYTLHICGVQWAIHETDGQPDSSWPECLRGVVYGVFFSVLLESI